MRDEGWWGASRLQTGRPREAWRVSADVKQRSEVKEPATPHRFGDVSFEALFKDLCCRVDLFVLPDAE